MSSEDSFIQTTNNRQYCMLHGKRSHSTDKCKDIRVITSTRNPRKGPITTSPMERVIKN